MNRIYFTLNQVRYIWMADFLNINKNVLIYSFINTYLKQIRFTKCLNPNKVKAENPAGYVYFGWIWSRFFRRFRSGDWPPGSGSFYCDYLEKSGQIWIQYIVGSGFLKGLNPVFFTWIPVLPGEERQIKPGDETERQNDRPDDGSDAQAPEKVALAYPEY